MEMFASTAVAEAVLQPVATLVGASLVLMAAGLTVRQRARADRRDQWWSRARWGMELSLSKDDDSIVLGLDVLAQQARARLIDPEDVHLVAEVLQPWVDSYAQPGAD